MGSSESERVVGCIVWNRNSINKLGLTTYRVVSSTLLTDILISVKKKKEKNGASRASFGALCVCVCASMCVCVPQAHTVEIEREKKRTNEMNTQSKYSWIY